MYFSEVRYIPLDHLFDISKRKRNVLSIVHLNCEIVPYKRAQNPPNVGLLERKTKSFLRTILGRQCLFFNSFTISSFPFRRHKVFLHVCKYLVIIINTIIISIVSSDLILMYIFYVSNNSITIVQFLPLVTFNAQ